MKNIKSIIAISAFSLLVLGLPAVASAQWRDRDQNDPTYRNDDYYGNGNGRYGRYNRNIRGTVESLQQRARNFERQVSRIDDRRDDRWGNRDDSWGNRGGYRARYDNLENLARSFKSAAEDLADEYGNGRNMRSSRDEAQRVVSIGSQIEQSMYRSGNRRGGNVGMLETHWSQISADLRVIANAYGLNYNGRGGVGNRFPFPLPF